MSLTPSLTLVRVPLADGCVIVGCMGGMAVPGVIHQISGSYVPFLLLSCFTTGLNFLTFVFLFFAHPIGPSSEPKAEKEMV